MAWRDFFLKNWVLKLISICFAVILWFFVVGEEKAEIGIQVPIEIVNLPHDLVISNDIPSVIDVRVYGPRSMIRLMTNQGVSKVIDLSGASAGTITVHITPDSLPLPGGVRAMRIQPSKFDIVLEPFVRKVLRVQPVLTGAVARDYEVSGVSVSPSAVELGGPASEMRRLREIKTLPIELNGEKKGFTREVGLDLQGLHVTVEDAVRVRVHVGISPQKGVRRINHVPVQLEATQTGISWWPKEVSVVLAGEKPSLNRLRVEDIKVVLSINGVKQGTHYLRPDFLVPPGLRVMKVIPQKIKVVVPKPS